MVRDDAPGTADDGLPPGAPDAAAVRAELARVLASPVMQQSAQLRRFLDFVVGEMLAGRATGLKAYTIGTMALGRKEDFDPQVDPIVRVEARRLRMALEEHYAGPGRGDPLRITLPRGGYVPAFVPPPSPRPGVGEAGGAGDAHAAAGPSAASPAKVDPPADGAPGTSSAAPPSAQGPQTAARLGPPSVSARRPLLAWGPAAGAVVLAAVLSGLVSGLLLQHVERGKGGQRPGQQGHAFAWSDERAAVTERYSPPGQGRPERPLATRRRLPLLQIQRFQVLDGVVPEQRSLILSARLRAALARFDAIVVAASPALDRDLARQDGLTPREAAAVTAHDLRDTVPDYILVGRFLRDPQNRPRLQTEVLHRMTGQVVGAFTVDQPPVLPSAGQAGGGEEAPGATAETPFGDGAIHYLSSSITQPMGLIARFEFALPQDVAGPLGSDGTAYACVLRAVDYFRSYERRELDPSLGCLERVVADDPDFAVAWAHLAFVRIERYRVLPERTAAAAALGEAYQAARRAMQAKPFSARSNQALADVLFVQGRLDEARETAEHALSLNPYDPDVEADLAARLLALGELNRGEALLRDAVHYTPARPPWYDFYLFLAAMLRGDTAAMAERAAGLTSDQYALGLVARVIVARRQGAGDTAAQLTAQLTAQDPTWARDPGAALARYRFAPPLRDALAAAFRGTATR